MLFTAGQHAREHLTVEMALYLIDELTASYATDPRIKGIVDSREIWIVPSVNPDGSEYDIEPGTLPLVAQEPPAERGLERDRHRPQPQLGLQAGAAAAARAASSRLRDVYRGPSAFSAPETQAVRNFVAQPRRRRRPADPGLDRLPRLQRAGPVAVRPHARRRRQGHDAATSTTRSRRSATSMARTNGYTPQQSSDLYITDGAIDDWLWGAHGDLRLHVRDVPRRRRRAPASIPPDELIRRETTPQPRGGPAAARGGRVPVRGDRQGGAVLRHRAADDDLHGQGGEADAADRADRRRQLRRQLPLPLEQAHEQRPAAGRRRRHAHAVPRARALGRVDEGDGQPQPLRRADRAPRVPDARRQGRLAGRHAVLRLTRFDSTRRRTAALTVAVAE